jgi:hypothetical protein
VRDVVMVMRGTIEVPNPPDKLIEGQIMLLIGLIVAVILAALFLVLRL